MLKNIAFIVLVYCGSGR